MHKLFSNLPRITLLLSMTVLALVPARSYGINSADATSLVQDSTYYIENDQNCGPITSGAPGKPVIEIDPGHSNIDKTVIDKTGLHDHDYPNHPEMEEVFAVATAAQTQLTAAGYDVRLTKSKADEYQSLRSRADKAAADSAVLAISLHNDHSQPFASWGQISPQKVGLFRSNGPVKVTFSDAGVAAKSQAAAAIFQTERAKAEGHSSPVSDLNFNGRAGIDPGNIAEVELYATVPWVYNEVGGIGFDSAKYTAGIVNSVKAAVPATPTSNAGSTGGCCPAGGSTGGSVALTGDNPQDVWNNLRAQGFNPNQTAGIMGNMQSESGFDPLIIQGGGHSADPAAAGSGGYGLVQWAPGSKLIPYLHGKQPDIISEVQGLTEQLAGKGPAPEQVAGDAIKAATTLQQATEAFELKYERHAGPPQPVRYTQAQAIYAKYSGSTITGVSTPTSCGSTGGGNGSLAARIVQIVTAEIGDVGYMKYDSANEDWCADFVSWVLRQAGAPFTGGIDVGGYRIPGVASIMDWFKTHTDRAQWYDNNGTNIPQPGDILIHGGGVHTNIVVAVSGRNVTEVGGNQSCAGHVPGNHATSCVNRYSENLNGSDITGWGRMLR